MKATRLNPIPGPKNPKPEWYAATAKYGKPDIRKATWQLIDTLVPYAALWVLMVLMVKNGYPYGITLALAMVAGGLLVRIFILFHDCCHGSFFASRRANTLLGAIAGILVFTAFDDWRRAHGRHHATFGDLDRRGTGDIWTMTVAEYRAAPLQKRLAYRLFRNPLVLFGPGPVILFLIINRFPTTGARRRERTSVLLTDLAIVAIFVLAGLTIGLRTYLLIQLPIIFVASCVGMWLFYVQHQFEGVYWARHENWDSMRVALEGSSYYRLPGVLQWFTGNIGLHHVHHVRPRIPNYHLQQCCDGIPALQAVRPLTLRASLRSLRLNLWDETHHKLVGFRELKSLPQSV
jgi:omega-6 fatty acid desaturase (delta-12 desaturase)